MPELLTVEGLVSGYGNVPVLHGIDLTIGEGELIAVIGSNGAGKTTLIRTICGITRSFAGTMTFAGRSIAHARASTIARLGIAHVPENRRVFAEHPIEENIRLGAWVRRRDRKGVAADLAEMYARFPFLGQRRTQPAGTLSGGQQQMLVIAMAMMARPRLLMLDEPSLGLAPIIVQQVFEQIAELKAAGTTILLSEQFANEALAIADRAIVLKLGEVLKTGTPAEIGADPAIRAAYL